MITKKTFFSSMNFLADSYDKLDIIENKNLLKSYYECLKSYTSDELQRAVLAHVKKSKYFPKISELVELIEISSTEIALERWNLVVQQLSRALECDDEIAHECVLALGGYRKLGALDQRSLDFISNRFVDLYKIKANRVNEQKKRRVEEDNSDRRSGVFNRVDTITPEKDFRAVERPGEANKTTDRAKSSRESIPNLFTKKS